MLTISFVVILTAKETRKNLSTQEKQESMFDHP